MESKFLWSSKQDYPEELPSLFQYIASHSVAGFDNFGKSGGLNNLCQLIETPTTNPSPDYTSAEEAQLSASQSHGYSLLDCLSKSSVPAVDLHKVHSISISMPSSPDGFQLEKARRVLFSNEDRINANHETTVIMKNSFVSNSEQQKVAKFYSQPLPAGCAYAKAVAEGRLPNNLEQQQRNMIRSRRKDIRFDSLKTLSGTLERQLSNLRGKQPEVEPDINDSQNAEIKDLPVDRYLDALEGPELDTLRASEELALPEDQQWPFLLRFPISSFAPSIASMAWARIQGEFDYGSRIAYFIALFLYISLVVRVNFFRGFRFSLAWWAYTFPMTSASIATIKYSNVVKNPFTQSLSVVLSAISTLIVTTLLVCTFVHGFVRWDLFPNDVAIAITERWPKGTKKHSHLQSMSLDT